MFFFSRGAHRFKFVTISIFQTLIYTLNKCLPKSASEFKISTSISLLKLEVRAPCPFSSDDKTVPIKTGF